MDSGLSSLGRYPLSIILSFLSETEGTSLLLTQSRFTRQVLPLFRLPLRFQVLGRPKRHRYCEIPVQDPETLLDRLNTRRLRQRCRCQRSSSPYTRGMTTSELAEAEWNAATLSWPAHLELLRFLSDTERNSNDWGGVTLLASYPRSGNTLLRNLLERVTGIVTGADTRPDRPLSKSLALDHNLVGEGVVTQGVYVVKTHYPERKGFPIHAGNRAILLIRNPYDAIDSYWNLNLTNTHTETVTDDVYARFSDFFEKLAANEMGTWIRFHQYWWKECKVPVLVVRFEDLILDTEREMGRIICFVTNQAVLTNFWQARIRHACSGSTTATLGSYRPRSATGEKKSIGKSLRKGRYSQSLLKEFNDIAKQHDPIEGTTMLRYFGYDLDQGFPDNFVEHSAPSLANHRRGSVTSITVNNGPMVRPSDDPYGRPMRHWRRKYTNKDANPFPTVSRS